MSLKSAGGRRGIDRGAKERACRADGKVSKVTVHGLTDKEKPRRY